MARHLVLWAGLVVVIIPVAACGGTNDARIPSPELGSDGGHDGAGQTGAQPCGPNASSGPTRLAYARSPDAIAVDGANVYWIDSDLGTVNEVSACGGAPTTLVTTSTLGSSTLIPAGIAVEGNDVYFTTQDPWNPDPGAGGVWKVPSAGGTPTMLVQGLDRPGPIAVTGATMYWIDSRGTLDDEGEIVQASIDGSSMIPLASAQNGLLGLALGGGRVVWTTAGLVQSVRGTLWTMPMAGGIADGIAAGQDMPVSVAVEGQDAFWADQGDPNVLNSGSIMKIPVDPMAAGDPVTLASGGTPEGIAVDATNAYWIDSQTQSVSRIPLAGGTPTTVAAHQVDPLAIVLDDTSVYWTTPAVGSGQGSVMKIAK